MTPLSAKQISLDSPFKQELGQAQLAGLEKGEIFIIL